MSPQTAAANFLTQESEKTYRDSAKRLLTSHQLADFRRCPRLYHEKKIGLIADEDRPAYALGRAAHTLILEGRERFEQDYAVGGPVNPKTGEVYGSATKAYGEWAAAQGKPTLNHQQADLIKRLGRAVDEHGLARDLLAHGTPEGVVRATYRSVACQSRIDFFNPACGIVDLKTTDNMDYFVADAKRYGYLYQMAFYRAMVQIAAGLRPKVWFIAVEKSEPFRCGVWAVGEDALDFAQRENEGAIDRLRLCQEQGHFPTGYEDCREFDSY